MTSTIPIPPAVPFLGHVTSIEKEVPLRSFSLLSKQYGEIFQLNLIGRSPYFINSVELVNDVSDDKKFAKSISKSLNEVRNAIGDGLFTAFKDEPGWGIAHRLLMPAFGTASIRDMFPDMLDIAKQLVLKWERFGPRHKIDPADDFTRLTLDTIALCSMSYRLNSFYRESNHPFVSAMVDFLVESGLRANRPAIVNTMMRGTTAKYEQDIKTMAELADEIIAERREHPVDHKDLLNIMLYSTDSKSGERLSDETIKNNLLTFLIAGHETTSGLLTFTLYYLVKNPDAMRKAREEVDEVLGASGEIQLTDIGKLKYIAAAMRESLRLSPTAPVRTVSALDDAVIGGGKYFIPKGAYVVINAERLHRDPKVFGDDADEFKPERMLDGKFEKLPPNAWQPFGFGMRACIGRPFAWQEALMALALIIQKFDLTLDDPSYELELKQTLTIKPAHFYVHAATRSAHPRPIATPSTPAFRAPQQVKSKVAHKSVQPDAEPSQPMCVLYGSNTGTSESFAQRIADTAAEHGFRATIGTLDSVAGGLPTDGPVIVVCASFEGEPADNAGHFVQWLTSLKDQELTKLRFAVFGCGNKDWSQTYQRIPKLIDNALEQRGGKRILARGEGDASAADFFEAFDTWEAKLWEILPEEFNTVVKKGVFTGLEVHEVDEGTARAADLRQHDAALGVVVENRVLTAPGAHEKRHIEFELPKGMTTRAGDYLAILPSNPPRDVHRAVSRFGLLPEQEVSLTSSGPTSLPVGRPITVTNLLSGYVELSQPATSRDLRLLLESATQESTKQAVKALSDSYVETVLAKRISVLDVLEDHPDLKISFATFLSLLPSMRVRQYSISSSPLWNPEHVTLTVSVLENVAISGRKEPFLGVASTFLANLRPGDKVQMAVRASNAAFHLPQDPATPLVLFGAGSGLAPLRGFLQERALQKKAGREVGEAILFFGCRSPKEDYLYSDSDLKEWEELGILKLRPAFSRATEESHGCKYIQDRAWHDRMEIDSMYKAGARFYVCGAGRVARAIKETLTTLIKEVRNLDDEQASAMFERATVGRFATDIFE